MKVGSEQNSNSYYRQFLLAQRMSDCNTVLSYLRYIEILNKNFVSSSYLNLLPITSTENEIANTKKLLLTAVNRFD